MKYLRAYEDRCGYIKNIEVYGRILLYPASFPSLTHSSPHLLSVTPHFSMYDPWLPPAVLQAPCLAGASHCGSRGPVWTGASQYGACACCRDRIWCMLALPSRAAAAAAAAAAASPPRYTSARTGGVADRFASSAPAKGAVSCHACSRSTDMNLHCVSDTGGGQKGAVHINAQPRPRNRTVTVRHATRGPRPEFWLKPPPASAKVRLGTAPETKKPLQEAAALGTEVSELAGCLVEE